MCKMTYADHRVGLDTSWMPSTVLDAGDVSSDQDNPGPPSSGAEGQKKASRQIAKIIHAKIIHGKCFSGSGRVMRCVAAWGDFELGGPVHF